jgi:hypothetical protein
MLMSASCVFRFRRLAWDILFLADGTKMEFAPDSNSALIIERP